MVLVRTFRIVPVKKVGNERKENSTRNNDQPDRTEKKGGSETDATAQGTKPTRNSEASPKRGRKRCGLKIRFEENVMGGREKGLGISRRKNFINCMGKYHRLQKEGRGGEVGAGKVLQLFGSVQAPE